MSKSKKIIIIFSVVAFIIAIGVGVYFGIKKSNRIIINTEPTNSLPISNNNKNNTTNTNNTESTSLPNSIGEKIYGENGVNIIKLNKIPSVDFWLYTPSKKYLSKTSSNSNKVTSSTLSSTSTSVYVFYIDDKGNVDKVSYDGKGDKTIVSSPNNEVPLRVLSNKDGSWSAVEFENENWKLFNVHGKNWNDIDSNIESMAFSPDGGRVAYVKDQGNNIGIYTYNLIAPHNLTLILKLPVYNMNIMWPSKNDFILLPNPSAYVKSDALSVNIKDGSISKIASSYGLMMKFGDNGFGIKSLATAYKNYLSYIIDYNGKAVSKMPFFTIPSKCSFFKGDMFCAYPNFNYDGNKHIIPDDYLSRDVYSRDALYKININTGMATEYLKYGKYDIDVSKIKNIDDNTIIFRNRLNGGIYRMFISSANTDNSKNK